MPAPCSLRAGARPALPVGSGPLRAPPCCGREREYKSTHDYEWVSSITARLRAGEWVLRDTAAEAEVPASAAKHLQAMKHSVRGREVAHTNTFFLSHILP